jgi:phosphoenolpyruvate carboxylase
VHYLQKTFFQSKGHKECHNKISFLAGDDHGNPFVTTEILKGSDDLELQF